MTPDDTQNPHTEPGNPLIDVSESNLFVGSREDVERAWKARESEYHRISRICTELAQKSPLIERIENLLGLQKARGSDSDRIGLIAVQLSSRPSLIDNAEHLIRMGS